MTLNSMRRDFVNLQDRCRAAIVKRIKSKSDLEKIGVPPGIRAYLNEGMLDPVTPFLPLNKYYVISSI